MRSHIEHFYGELMNATPATQKIYLATCSLLVGACLCSCTIDAQIADMYSKGELRLLSRIDPDGLQGEIRESSGYEIRGVFGEVSEKQVLPSGYEVNGVFYE